MAAKHSSESVDLSGQHFGLWTILGPTRRHNEQTLWLAECTCLARQWVQAEDLRSGKSTNCGCVLRPLVSERNRKHGLSHSREYQIYHKMIRRCENPQEDAYPNYGGRGIKVCQRWRTSFEAFILDVGLAPSPKHELDRVNNDGDYEPGNVRWVTSQQNARNKRSNTVHELDGLRLTLTEWAERIGAEVHALSARINELGWPIRKALTTPVKRYKTSVGLRRYPERTVRTARRPPNFIDLTGECFGLWTVIGPMRPEGRRSMWLAECTCLVRRWVSAGDFGNGKSTNCGCVRRVKVGRRNYKHGMGDSRLHVNWLGMIARCENPRHKDYHRYGGRGIKVCQRWRESFTAFLEDMGSPPSEKHMVDRVNNDGDYEKSNCRWVTNKENARNRPGVLIVEFQGITLPLNEWTERQGLPPVTVRYRIQRYGWSVHDALTTPVLSHSESAQRQARKR